MLLLPTACSGLTVPQTSLGTLKVAPVGLGTLNFPLDKTEDPSTADALRAALGKGVNLVDTAEAYGFGKSEELTRWALREAQASGEVAVATKFAPVPWRQSADDVVAACQASRERLGVEQIDLYQIHFPDIIQPLKPFGLERRKEEEYWDGLARCYEAGLAESVGTSNFGPNQLRKANAYWRKRGVPHTANQVQLSLLSTLPVESGLLDACAELGVTPIGYSPLGLGVLSGKYDERNLPDGPRGLIFRALLPSCRPLLATLREVAAARQVSVSAVAINWAMSKGAVVIVGMKTPEQVRENLGALGWRISGAESDELERAARLAKTATQNIFQTD